MEDLKLILKDISHKVDRILDQQEKHEELLNLYFNGKLDLSYANKFKTKETQQIKNNLSNNLQI